MNSIQLEHILTNTVTSVFEEAVYALVEREQEPCPDDALVVESLISFKGTYTGTIALEVEAKGVAPMTNDLLGCDESQVPPNCCNEAIGELANIIAGRLLEAWLPQQTDYDIGIPSVSSKVHSQTHLVNEPQVCVARLRTDSGIHVTAAVLMGVWS
jgi:hypothetical protein